MAPQTYTSKSGGSFRSILGALEERTEVILLVLPFIHGHLNNSKNISDVWKELEHPKFNNNNYK